MLERVLNQDTNTNVHALQEKLRGLVNHTLTLADMTVDKLSQHTSALSNTTVHRVSQHTSALLDTTIDQICNHTSVLSVATNDCLAGAEVKIQRRLDTLELRAQQNASTSVSIDNKVSSVRSDVRLGLEDVRLHAQQLRNDAVQRQDYERFLETLFYPEMSQRQGMIKIPFLNTLD